MYRVVFQESNPGLLLGTEALIMVPNGAYLHFSFSCFPDGAHEVASFCWRVSMPTAYGTMC